MVASRQSSGGRGSAWVPLPLLGLALTVAAGFLPSQVQASCGDYVTIGSHFGMSASPMDRQLDNEPLGRPGRCSGPECSRNSVPPAVPPASGPVHAHEWASMLNRMIVADRGRGTVSAAESLGGPQAEPGAIFHPPRHAVDLLGR
jgi:hypothetical protein